MLKLDPQERASVPELLGHCWLRSAVGIEFETKRKNSYTGGAQAESVSSLVGDSRVDGKAIVSAKSKDFRDSSDETTPPSSASSSAARKLKLLTSESGDYALDSISELILESPRRSRPSPRSPFHEEKDKDVFSDLVFSPRAVPSSISASPDLSPSFKLEPLRRSKSGSIISPTDSVSAFSPSSAKSGLPAFDTQARPISSQSKGPKLPIAGDYDFSLSSSPGAMSAKGAMSQNTFQAPSAGSSTDRRATGFIRQSALHNAGALSLRSHRVNGDPNGSADK